MATSNPASISRFAEIGRQQILREVRRERLAAQAAEGAVPGIEADEPRAVARPVMGAKGMLLARVRAVVLGVLG